MAKHTHTLQDLIQMQSLPLSVKIRMTERRVRDWVNEFGQEGVYVSFSGGKDSTVLVDIVRNRLGFTDIPLVFVDTGLEYPEIRNFVKTFDNVEMIKPDMTFRKVIESVGYPFISKEVAYAVDESRKFLMNKDKYKDRKPIPVQNPNDEYKPYSLLKLQGELKYRDGTKSIFCQDKWYFMVDAPFNISNKCCNIMKKNPFKKYHKETGRVPITAQMTEESRMRLAQWLRNGCNNFEGAKQISNPMSFWTEQDVLRYIKQFNIPICSVYGDVVPDYGDEQCDGQLDFSDFGLIDDQRKLKTTGLRRTGCMFCGFGCHLDIGESRFEKMKKTHPKLYEYIMRPWEQEVEKEVPDKRYKDGKKIIRSKIKGLNYKEVIDWINEHGNLNIRY